MIFYVTKHKSAVHMIHIDCSYMAENWESIKIYFKFTFFSYVTYKLEFSCNVSEDGSTRMATCEKNMHRYY